MSARSVVALGVLAAFALAAGDASAWEAYCRDEKDVRDRLSQTAVRDSICAPASAHECEDGLAAARGVYTGEHRYIADVALRMVGLGLPDDPNALPVIGSPISEDGHLFDYWTDGAKVDLSGPGAEHSRETPAGPSGMHRRTARSPWLAELAELPDVSYSLADWLLGNETCVSPNALLRYSGPEHVQPQPMSERSQIDACHAFTAHMGAVNSTHFGSQAAAMYILHHKIALAVQDRCKAMWTAAKELNAYVAVRAELRDRIIPACEREAFAYEAVGAHYLEDAWASGHMWERWGSPIAEGDLDLQLRQSITAGIAGIEHGWRYVARNASSKVSGYKWLGVTLAGTEGVAQHDQLCMPGYPQRKDDRSQLAASDELVVRYTYAGGTDFPPAGGDLYLLACNQKKANDPTWAVAGRSNAVTTVSDEGTRMRPQWQRMVTCLAFGFDEVYRRGPGPETDYRATDRQPRDVGPFDPELVPHRGEGFGDLPADTVGGGTGLFHLCFGERVTNQSMLLGAGITEWGGFNEFAFSRAGFTVGQVPSVVADAAKLDAFAKTDWPGKPRKGKRFDGTHFDTLNADFALEIVQLQARLDMLARRNPHGIDSAKMPSDKGFLGSSANDAWTKTIVEGGVKYLEQPDPAKWKTTPITSSIAECTNDTACSTSTEDYDGSFCDRSNAYLSSDGSAQKQVCVPLETAPLRAFRAAETPYWCANDTAADFEAARRTCHDALLNGGLLDDQRVRNALGGLIPECQACAEMIVPHVRPSCNAKAYEYSKSVERRSTCDVLKDGGVPQLKDVDLGKNAVYAPFASNAAGDALQAARFVCAVANIVPTDATPDASVPSRRQFVASGGVGACFSTCDGCTTCYGTELTASLEEHVNYDFPRVGYRTGPQFERSLLFGAGTNFEDMALGYRVACAVRSDKTVWCSGSNTYGALGTGSLVPGYSIVPLQIPGITDATRLLGLGDGMCALDSKGAVSCWGRGGDGVFGDGTDNTRYTPAPIAGLPPVAELAVARASGYADVCARTTGGDIYCWGGTGTSGLRTPRAIEGVSGATKLLSQRACYLAGDQMSCWFYDDPCTLGTCCSNSVPVNGWPFAPVEAAAQSSLICIRGADGRVACSADFTSNFDAMNQCIVSFTVKNVVEQPVKVDMLVTGGSGLYMRKGNELYASNTQQLSAVLPLAVATEAPLTCP